MSFAHLHVHTHYSLLESTIKIPELIQKTKQLGMPAVAITDSGNLFGGVEFYLAAKDAGIKPILGAEIYYTRTPRHQKPTKNLKTNPEELENFRNFQLVLLCKNMLGYRNLCELITLGYTEGFHLKPRVDYELLLQKSEGLIALTSGLKGEVGYQCAMGRPEDGQKTLNRLKDIFKGNLYIEVQENGITEQSHINRTLLELSQMSNIPMVATADAHYLNPEESHAQQVLMCIEAGRNLDPHMLSKNKVNGFWFKDIDTLKKQFDWIPQALTNTLEIADACNFEFLLKNEKGQPIYFLPDFTPEHNYSVSEYLVKKAQEGLQVRFIEPTFKKLQNLPHWEKLKSEYLKRLDSELEMIEKTGFPGYFLVVSDFIDFAKSKKIPVGPGRGSGVGSLVAYALKITDLNPLPCNLLFERFINPERISLPDFDIDFCQERRQEVIDYVVGKYGKDRVSQIITFGKLLARGVIRDVGRVFGLPYKEVDSIAKLIPEELGVTLKTAFEKEPQLKELTESNPQVAKLFEIARILEGVNRHASVHAAGVVITNRPLIEYCPLYVGKDNELVIQFDKDYAEKIGLVKFDFLGLKTLTVLSNTVKLIHEQESALGVKEEDFFHLEKIELEDLKVYKLISSGDTDGVFQLESSGMKDLCIRAQPTNLEDLTAINALYRPGPLNSGMVDDYISRKHGKTPVVYELPQLKEILEETYGVIVYQEQVMRIARVLAGYTLGEADILRRAMGKKKPDEMAKQRDKFVQGCEKNQVTAEKAVKIFELLAKFAEYGFNKSHSAAYSMLSIQTAYLKAHYPAQFMAALMATEMNNTEKMAQYISDARSHGIEILPPDINESNRSFSVTKENEKTAIRFGLEAIKGVGGVAVEAILQERLAHGVFHTFLDFCKRVLQRKVNKKVLEALISTGCFDKIEQQTRATLFESIEGVMQFATKHQKDVDLAQVSFFDQYNEKDLKNLEQTTNLFKISPEWSESKKLQLEKQLVGFYVSAHPVENIWVLAKNFVSGDFTWVREEFEKKKTLTQGPSPRWDVTLVAIVNSIRETITKKGSKMAFVDLEDAKAKKLDAICFTEAFEQYGSYLKKSLEECEPLVLLGNISLDEEIPRFFVRSTEFFSEYIKKNIHSVVFKFNPSQMTAESFSQLRSCLVRHPGKVATYLESTGCIDGIDFESRHALPQDLFVRPSSEFIKEVNGLFGDQTVKLT